MKKKNEVWRIIDERTKENLGFVDGFDDYYAAYVEACELIPKHRNTLEVIREEPMEVM